MNILYNIYMYVHTYIHTYIHTYMRGDVTIRRCARWCAVLHAHSMHARRTPVPARLCWACTRLARTHARRRSGTTCFDGSVTVPCIPSFAPTPLTVGSVVHAAAAGRSRRASATMHHAAKVDRHEQRGPAIPC